MNLSDTIAAVATAPGRSAIAVIRVSGPQARAICLAMCRRGSLLPRRATFVRLLETRTGDWLDDALLIYFPGPRSYTGEDLVEVQTHGSPLIVRRVLAELFVLGARQAEAGEFTYRAYLNGRLDLLQAEAVGELISTSSEVMLQQAARALHGQVATRLLDVENRLLDLLALLEAGIDFPLDMPVPDSADFSARLLGLAELTAGLAASFDRAKKRREGLRVVIAGQPNVGKSSLFNALLGHPRALVSSEPGTTRDYLEETLMLGPVTLVLTDTAGLREATGEAEREGIARSLSKAGGAELVLHVLDGSVGPAGQTDLDLELAPDVRVLPVLNKADLPLAAGWEARLGGVIRVSATAGLGLDELVETLLKLAGELLPGGGDEDLWVLSQRQKDALLRASALLREAAAGVEHQPAEIQASLLGAALASVRELGSAESEDVLDRIFKSFCIGK